VKMPGATEVVSATFSSDGKKLFTLDYAQRRGSPVDDGRRSCVRHWDLTTGNQGKSWALPQEVGTTLISPTFKSLAPDGRKVFNANYNAIGRVEDARGFHSRLARRVGHFATPRNNKPYPQRLGPLRQQQLGHRVKWPHRNEVGESAPRRHLARSNR
jgi:hypothetical protein